MSDCRWLSNGVSLSLYHSLSLFQLVSFPSHVSLTEISVLSDPTTRLLAIRDLICPDLSSERTRSVKRQKHSQYFSEPTDFSFDAFGEEVEPIGRQTNGRNFPLRPDANGRHSVRHFSLNVAEYRFKKLPKNDIKGYKLKRLSQKSVQSERDLNRN